MGKSTRPESPAEIPIPDTNPELSPDVPEDPIPVPPPKHPIVPEHPDKPEVSPDNDPDCRRNQARRSKKRSWEGLKGRLKGSKQATNLQILLR
jgi:hypothetical protein